MASNSVNMPMGFGGLTRFNEEYESSFNLKPTQVVLFIILIVIFRFSLGMFF